MASAKTSIQSDPSKRYLDLDAVKPPIDVVVKLGGVTHHLKPITVDDFIENLRLVERGKNVSDEKTTSVDDLAQHMAEIRAMLGRSFPTMTEEMLKALTHQQLNTLLEFAMSNGGADEIAKETEANPPKAGTTKAA